MRAGDTSVDHDLQHVLGGIAAMEVRDAGVAQSIVLMDLPLMKLADEIRGDLNQADSYAFRRGKVTV